MQNATCALLLMMLAISPGCTSSHTADTAGFDPLGAAPADFSLDVSVQTKSLPASTSASQNDLSSTHFVLLSDGSLRYSNDRNIISQDGIGTYAFPPLIRVLSRAQVAQVWSLAQQLGFTDPARSEPSTNPSTITLDTPGSVYLAEFSGYGRRWSFLRRSQADVPHDAAMQALVQHLARLAWVDDEPDIERAEPPKRYDFGPDPYAQYR